jgi:hypothetical protein
MIRWINNVFFALDRLMNAICGGSGLNTISARVGYHISDADKWHSKYWNGLAWIIDFTFKPVDGAGHCLMAYNHESRFFVANDGNDAVRALLGIVIAFSCLILIPIIYTFSTKFKT